MVKRKNYNDNNQHHLLAHDDNDVVVVNYADCRKSVRLLSILEEKEKQSKINKYDDKVLLSSSSSSSSSRQKIISGNDDKENRRRIKSNKKKKRKTKAIVDDINTTTAITSTTTKIAKYKNINQNYYRQPLTRNHFTDDDIQYCSCNHITGCGVNCENRLLYM